MSVPKAIIWAGQRYIRAGVHWGKASPNDNVWEAKMLHGQVAHLQVNARGQPTEIVDDDQCTDCGVEVLHGDFTYTHDKYEPTLTCECGASYQMRNLGTVTQLKQRRY